MIQIVDKLARLSEEFELILKFIDKFKNLADLTFEIPKEEYIRCQNVVYQSLKDTQLKVGFVFSDQHYPGDSCYLGGNTNITRICLLTSRFSGCFRLLPHLLQRFNKPIN
ncbi:MAG: hypothetical protein HWN66_03530 [Candidatus Helarchaeota archaeon]|nr:hypothetical protein [Candidatus Helarchaeota archaeon]